MGPLLHRLAHARPQDRGSVASWRYRGPPPPAADPALLVNPRTRTYLVRVETVNVTESTKRTTTKTVHLNEETGEIMI